MPCGSSQYQPGISPVLLPFSSFGDATSTEREAPATIVGATPHATIVGAPCEHKRPVIMHRVSKVPLCFY
eukprot:6173885-Pleurochrysis_carterae.AAC.1